MPRLSKYFSIFKMDFKQSLFYAADVMLSAIFIAVILFVFANLWSTIFAGKAAVEGFSIPMLIWYLALTEAITKGIGWRQMFENISDEIKSGNIANYLTKPLSYVGWYFSIYFSKFINYFTTVLLIGGIVTYLLVGPITFSFQAVVPLIILILLSYALSFFVGMTFALFAFWFEDVTAFFWIIQKALFILGGMLVPIDIYPEFIRGYLNYLPFSFITYWPGKYFVMGSSDIFAVSLVGQIVWLGVFAALTLVVYRFGVRRLNILGG